MSLDNNAEVLMDFESMMPIKVFDMDSSLEGFGVFYHEDKVKELIKKYKLEINRMLRYNKIDIEAEHTLNLRLDELTGSRFIDKRGKTNE